MSVPTSIVKDQILGLSGPERTKPRSRSVDAVSISNPGLLLFESHFLSSKHEDIHGCEG